MERKGRVTICLEKIKILNVPVSENVAVWCEFSVSADEVVETKTECGIS